VIQNKTEQKKKGEKNLRGSKFFTLLFLFPVFLTSFFLFFFLCFFFPKLLASGYRKIFDANLIFYVIQLAVVFGWLDIDAQSVLC